MGFNQPHLLLPVVLSFKVLPLSPTLISFLFSSLSLIPHCTTVLHSGAWVENLTLMCCIGQLDLVDLFCFTCRRSFTCCLSFKNVGQLKAELGGLLCLEGWIKPVALSCCYGAYIIGGSGTLLDINQGYITTSENSYTWKTARTPSDNSMSCVCVCVCKWMFAFYHTRTQCNYTNDCVM